MNRFVAFILKEFRHILRDRRTLMILFGMPLVQVLLFGYVLDNEVKNARIAVIDPTPDRETRLLTQMVFTDDIFIPAPQVRSVAGLEGAFRRNEIAMAVVLPAGFGESMAREGADVGINFLDDAAAAGRVADEVRALGRKVAVVKGDVARKADVEAFVSAASALGPPDILVNNAGVFPRSEFLALTEGEWDRVLGVNLKGGFLCAQAAARSMIAAGRPGAIVNISSSAIRGDARGVHYSASKAGVLGMTRAMALALAPHRIRVNAIAPGLTDTAQPRYGNTEEQLAARARDIPLGRMARPDEIARIAVFLASDDAAMMTGELMHVNGGVYMA